MTLLDLHEGDSAVIQSINMDQLPKQMLTELLELGFFPGAEIRLKTKSKYLGKLICSLGGTTIGLRMKDGEAILLKTK
ncbi:ferrous iron transport protein A [Leptospira levettii]|uniref:Ferrous iron transport protein A n=1 Tax=Leptospira levettii TaxID=2023178 RepID=A0ABY2MLA7_9LEPT|nr:FeoA family protein [Leptospira levettii]PKA27675.1 fatty-acid--CoA ligase [Leptospira sp. mixed culture ATI2-C-A1]MCG6148110.1 ferrous iron transport protein A [Leptospira levettii]MCW7495323.1 ferrous iron transport protein A [Leptospira levettii]MCW7508156.1 ferrous iron transport protein A [Leptospira levettii]MCW7519246.1 ferrous iron transport protein A [Leptospira levettii]